MALPGVKTSNVTPAAIADALVGVSDIDGAKKTVIVPFDTVRKQIAYGSQGGMIALPTLAALQAELNYAKDAAAMVMEDPLDGNNGYYRKLGPSGAGSWVRTGDLPYSFHQLTRVSGSGNTITATSPVPLAGTAFRALFLITWAGTNTGNVRIVIDGVSRVVRDQWGVELPAGFMVANRMYLMIWNGTQFQMMTDVAAATHAAAAATAASQAVAAAIGISAPLALDSVATLRALGSGYAGPAVLYLRGYHATRPGEGHGYVWHDTADTTGTDNGVTRFVDAGGRRWRRYETSDLTPEMAGAIGNDPLVDNTAALNALFAIDASLVFPKLYAHSGFIAPPAKRIVARGRDMNTTGLLFTGNAGAGQKAWAFTQEMPEHYLHFENMAFLTNTINAGTGFSADANLRAWQRVAQWQTFSRCKFGGVPDPAAIGDAGTGALRHESPYGFDVMVNLDQPHNLLFADCEIYGRQIVANAGRARWAIASALLRLSCPPNATSSPYLHPTGLRVINPRFSWGQKAIDVVNDFEGADFKGGELVGIDYGIYVKCENPAARRVLVQVDMHINAFVENVHIENCNQARITGDFYKRNDTDVRTYAVVLKNADDCIIDNLRATNNSGAADVLANEYFFVHVDGASLVNIIGGRATRCETLVSAVNGSTYINAQDVMYAPFNDGSQMVASSGGSTVSVRNCSIWKNYKERKLNNAGYTTPSAVFATITNLQSTVINVNKGDRFKVGVALIDAIKTTANTVRLGILLGGTATKTINGKADPGTVVTIDQADFLATPSSNAATASAEIEITATGSLTVFGQVSAMGGDLTVPLGNGSLTVEAI